MFVIDASVALSHCLGGPEFRDQARSTMAACGFETATVPAVWNLELANALLKKERQKVVNKKEVAELLARWANLPVTVNTLGLAGTSTDTLQLARKHNLSVYDAS
jgi:predicted nucleic acid-binding protein